MEAALAVVIESFDSILDANSGGSLFLSFRNIGWMLGEDYVSKLE